MGTWERENVRRHLGLFFLIVTVLIGAAVYNRVPEQMVTHFGAHGEPNGYMGRFWGVFLVPLLGFAIYAILTFLPRIMPRRENWSRFEDTYWFICNTAIGFLCAMSIVVIGYNLGWPVSIPTFVLLGVGFMFIVLGHALPKTRSNWLMGIRTPWTLDSERVWQDTHQLGGRTFMIGGVITMIAAFLPEKMQPVVGFGALMIAGFIPVVYSYFAWRREQK